MKRKWSLRVSVVICVTLVVILSPLKGDQANGQPIKIGALLSLTGPFVDPGKDFRAAIEVRLEEAGWKVAGRPIELIVEDDKSFDTATGLDKTKKMVVADKIHIMLGPLLSGIRLAVEPYIERAGIPNIAFSRHLPKAAKEGGWVFLPAGTLREFSKPMGWFAYEDMGFRKANTVADDNVAGHEYMGGTVEGFKQKGGTVLFEQFPPSPSADYAPYVSALKKDANVVMTWLGSRGTLDFLKTFYDFGLKDKMEVICVTGGEFLKEEHLPAFGDKVLGVTGLTDYNWRMDNPVNKKFVRSIEAKTGNKPSPFHSRGYEAISIAIAALEATGGDTTPEKLRKAISATKLDMPAGPVSFTSNNIGIRNMYAMKVQKVDGKPSWVVVKAYRQFSGN